MLSRLEMQKYRMIKKFDMKQAFESLQSALRYYHIGFSFQKHQNQSLHYAKLLTVKAKAEQKLGTNQNQSKTVSDAVSILHNSVDSVLSPKQLQKKKRIEAKLKKHKLIE
jgi:hypothetical protein